MSDFLTEQLILTFVTEDQFITFCSWFGMATMLHGAATGIALVFREDFGWFISLNKWCLGIVLAGVVVASNFFGAIFDMVF